MDKFNAEDLKSKLDNINKVINKNNNNHVDEDISQNTSDNSEIIDNKEEDLEDVTHNKKMAETIINLKQENDLLHDRLVRTLADTENARKRYEKRIEESSQYSITQFAKDLLPIMDNLNLSLEHKESDNLAAGIELTRSELVNIFKNKNIEEFKPQVGSVFDYNLHNAISQIVTNDQPEGSIINVMQSGYKIKDRLLRPALVAVAKNS